MAAHNGTFGAITATFDLLESKVHPPPLRRGVVPRTALLDLMTTVDAPVIAVTAPTGYGKTTLLSQWAERAAPRAAWVTLDERDNDPAALLMTLAAGLDRMEPLPPAVFDTLGGRRPVDVSFARLLAWIEEDREAFSLAVDHADAVTRPEAFDLLTRIALQLPPQHRMLVASRVAPRWPAPRLRALGRLFELRAAELALEPKEAAELLRRTGVPIDAVDVDALTARTEGWAAGLYLAALAMQTGTGEHVPTPRGGHPYLSDYLRSEVLDHLPADEVQFLTRTSVLSSLGAPLCDAVLEITDSASWLERIEREDLFVLPVDRDHRWYRVHQLFRDLLADELHRHEPQLVQGLHRRAATWYEEHGLLEDALEQARAGGDAPKAVALIERLLQPVWSSGRADTAVGWLRWLEGEDLLGVNPALAVHGALMYALTGRPVEAERWADAALATTAVGSVADGSTLDSQIAYLRAYVCRDGIEGMQRDARAANAGLSRTSPFRAGMLFVEGAAHRLLGELDDADRVLAHAVDVALAFDAHPQAGLTIVERGGVAADRGDWTAADASAQQALELVGDGTYDAYWTSAVVFAWGARLAGARRGDIPEAEELLVRATRLRPLLTYALPVTSVRSLVEMARAYVAIGDPQAAGSVVRQAREILRQRPGLGLLAAEVETMHSLPAGGSSLSAAELRIVPFLATHLTLQEIADQVYLSRHTVKTHSIAIYRKVGVSSRRDAIARLQEMGLLVS